VLKDHRKRQMAERLAVGPEWRGGSDDYVSVSAWGEPATTLLRAGVPVHVVAARLGHADPSITLRVYAHVISEQLAEAAVIFARAVGDD
jgi:integrase